jgi:hypothetical protein
LPFQKKLTTFASVLVVCLIFVRHTEKGIRLKSGAVPAAVNSAKVFEHTFATANTVNRFASNQFLDEL